MSTRYFSVIPKGSTDKILLDERGFESFFKVSYLPQLEFDNWIVEQSVKKKCQKALKKAKISEVTRWLGKFHENELSNADIPDITIQEVHPKVGYGVITNCDLKQWQFIGEYTGIIRRRALLFPELNDYCFAYPKEWISFKPFTIDSEKAGNFTRFINHSDQANLESIAVIYNGYFHILFRTLCAIKAHTELTYNYGDIYWKKREKLDSYELN